MSGNGNGHGLSKRTLDIHEEPGALGPLMKVPPWLQAIRDAMQGSISGDDLKAIMQAQIEKAKEGDMKAAAFVMGQAHKMMQSEQKRLTIVQNNYYGQERAAHSPASPLTQLEPVDGAERDLAALVDAKLPPRLSDEEEKELRRKQQQEEEEGPDLAASFRRRASASASRH